MNDLNPFTRAYLSLEETKQKLIQMADRQDKTENQIANTLLALEALAERIGRRG
jgi:hypothetical protein